MKNLKEISTLVKVASAMVNEAKGSEAAVKAKADVKESFKGIKASGNTSKLAKNIIASQKTKLKLAKEMLNSDEAEFIKTAIKESEGGKKLANNLDAIGDMIPWAIKREYTNYRYWLINNYSLLKFTLSVPPAKLLEMFMKHQWMIDFTKGNAMSTRYQEGRTGANFYSMHEELKYVIAVNAQMLTDAINHPERLILLQNVVATEILSAMGLFFHPCELGSTLGKLDQWAVLPYLEAGEAAGLSVDTCGLPKSTLGMCLENDFPEATAILGCNYPCDGGMASYSLIADMTGLPIFRLNMPYDLRGEGYVDNFVQDLKDMIIFLEANTPGRMDWDKLRTICEGYNKMVELEYERWEMTKMPNPPLTNDCLQQTHYYNFSYLSSLPMTVKLHEKLYNMNKKAIAKGQSSFDNMRYRAVIWNPPPSAWGHWYGWIERCWGVGVVFDIETSGTMWHIDTTDNETMLKGLAKRYMWQIMAKHTKGPASNYLGDFYNALEDYKPDFIIYPKPIGCKNVMTMEGTIKEECKKRNLPLCMFKMELQDNRVASRQQMKDEFTKFMTEIMHAEPLDASLLRVDDSDAGKW